MFNIYFKEMKKFISLIALVGVFAACEPENLQTAFTVSEATATINVTVLCPAPGFDPSAATVTYAWSNGATTQSITGNPAIAAGSVTVTASYDGASRSETVSFPQIFAGMDAVLNATVLLPYNAGGYEVDFDVVDETKTVEVYGLIAAAHGHGYKAAQTVEYGGQKYKVYMMENASEFILEDTYSWTSYDGFLVNDDLVVNPETAADFGASVEEIYDYVEYMSYMYYDEIEESLDFSVGAWSLYNVINPVFTTTDKIAITATPLPGSNNPALPVLGTFSISYLSSAAGAVEIAHPDHASHYVPHSGHYTHDGHALHGDNNNAGGGIITAE